jgi:transposase-like protein
MGKKMKERPVYTREFKAEAVALAEKREKSVRQIAQDRWIQRSKAAEKDQFSVFPGHGRPRDEELVRLRKENKALKSANEILKKRRPSSHKEPPRNGVPVHASEPGTVCHQGDGRTFWGIKGGLLPMGTEWGIGTEEAEGRRVNTAYPGDTAYAS